MVNWLKLKFLTPMNIDITIHEKRRNALRSRNYKGAYVIETNSNSASGLPTESHYVVYRNGPMGMKYSKIPMTQMGDWYTFGKDTEIIVLKTDTETFYPVRFEDNKLVYRAEVFEDDGTGNPVIDEKTKKPKIIGYEVKTLIETGYVMENNKIVKAPSGLAQKTYDPFQWFGQTVLSILRLYEPDSAKQLKSFMIIFGIIALIAIAAFQWWNFEQQKTIAGMFLEQQKLQIQTFHQDWAEIKDVLGNVCRIRFTGGNVPTPPPS